MILPPCVNQSSTLNFQIAKAIYVALWIILYAVTKHKLILSSVEKDLYISVQVLSEIQKGETNSHVVRGRFKTRHIITSSEARTIELMKANGERR